MLASSPLAWLITSAAAAAISVTANPRVLSSASALARRANKRACSSSLGNAGCPRVYRPSECCCCAPYIMLGSICSCMLGAREDEKPSPWP
eukprot:3936449-Pleurochrysis_carterae.AAC.2